MMRRRKNVNVITKNCVSDGKKYFLPTKNEKINSGDLATQILAWSGVLFLK